MNKVYEPFISSLISKITRINQNIIDTLKQTIIPQ